MFFILALFLLQALLAFPVVMNTPAVAATLQEAVAPISLNIKPIQVPKKQPVDKALSQVHLPSVSGSEKQDFLLPTIQELENSKRPPPKMLVPKPNHELGISPKNAIIPKPNHEFGISPKNALIPKPNHELGISPKNMLIPKPKLIRQTAIQNQEDFEFWMRKSTFDEQQVDNILEILLKSKL